MTQAGDEPALHPGRAESDRIHLRAYYAALAATALIVLTSVWLVVEVFPHFDHALPDVLVAPITRYDRAPVPRLEVDARGDLEALRAAERARLTSYGWVDQGRGVVHIPIDVAMRRLLERGLPVRKEARDERR